MSQTRTAPNSVTRIQSGRGDDGVVRCFCGAEALYRKSNTEKNPNRWFYKCDTQKCKFFKWEDELLASPSNPRPSQAQPSSRGPSTPTPTQGQGQGRTLGGPSTPTQSHSLGKRPAPAEEDDVSALFSDEDVVEVAGPSPLKKFRFAPGVKKAQEDGAGKNQWEVIRDDPDNPFHATARSLIPTPQSTPVASTSAFAAATPSTTTPSATTPSTSTTTTTPSLLSALQTLSQHLPEHLQRTERKLVAAERSRDSKSRRITELEAEVARLKEELAEKSRVAERVGVLEETIEALRARQ